MVTCAAPLCGPTCLPFSIVLSGVTGVAARHGAPLGFEKAWRAAAASSLPSQPFAPILLPRPLCPARLRQNTESW